MRRSDMPDGLYHMTGRATGSELLYRCDLDRNEFLALVRLAADRFGWRLHARCLMDNHYHVLLEATRPNLSAGMHLLHGMYTKRYNKRHGRRGCLFEGRFTATLIESDHHYTAALEYIRQNPVVAGLCQVADDWRWTELAERYRNAGVPVRAPPMTSVCTSCVPS
jgi:REP element-mobilizing transposase RayT